MGVTEIIKNRIISDRYKAFRFEKLSELKIILNEYGWISHSIWEPYKDKLWR